MSALLATTRSLPPAVQTLLAPIVCSVVLLTAAGQAPPSVMRAKLPDVLLLDDTVATVGVPRQLGTVWIRLPMAT